MPWHAQSTFSSGPRRPFSIGDRALWLARLHAARLARLISASHAEVARALLKRLGTDGRLDPAQSTLAADTGLDERTVGRAVRRLADAGLLTWQRRLVRVGWAARQTSNSYELVPAGPAMPAPPLKERKRSCSTGILPVAGGALTVEQQMAFVKAWARDCEGVTRGATVG